MSGRCWWLPQAAGGAMVTYTTLPARAAGRDVSATDAEALATTINGMPRSDTPRSGSAPGLSSHGLAASMRWNNRQTAAGHAQQHGCTVRVAAGENQRTLWESQYWQFNMA